MKKRTITLVALLLVAVSVMSIGLTACGLFDDDDNGESNTPAEPVKYTIQYTDDNGTHTITVESGQPYSIDIIPERTGYEFTGLYDAQTGGTQYVAANGSSVSPFTDNKNMVLFPQFKAKQYKVVLNYGDAPVTGMREIDVDYNTELPELPINLTVANKDFKGWYTEPNCGGTQIADTYGVLPDRRLVTEQNFDLSNANGYIYLYAGFTGTMRTVTFYVGYGNAPIEMQVEHGTLISDVVPDYRDENGYAVLEWTQEPNPTDASMVFKGEITRDMTLYAKTYAPVIEFDTNGGEEIIPLVQTAGKNITLPTPVRTNYKFLHWANASGEKVAYSTMPSESVELTAVWQAMLVFDENGGDEVKDISEASGTTIVLPSPTRGGYIFAGWFDVDGEKYESTRMPADSQVLKAGWYIKNETIVTVIEASKSLSDQDRTANMGSKLCFTFDFDKYFEQGQEANVVVDWHMNVRYGNISSVRPAYVEFYNKKIVSSANLLEAKTFSEITNAYMTIEFTTEFKVSDDFYMCWYGGTGAYPGISLYLSDFYYTVYYPDTSVMY